MNLKSAAEAKEVAKEKMEKACEIYEGITAVNEAAGPVKLMLLTLNWLSSGCETASCQAKEMKKKAKELEKEAEGTRITLEEAKGVLKVAQEEAEKAKVSASRMLLFKVRLITWAWRSSDFKEAMYKQVDMDTSNPAVFVNAELLHAYMGRKVRTVIQVMSSDGGTVIGKSTDEKQLVVKGSPPVPLTTYVEVIGIADSNQSIRAEIWNNFGDTFGALTSVFCNNIIQKPQDWQPEVILSILLYLVAT
ncbi:hypothetical protein RHSIM_Rhsim02G0090500 [Rhododendron simsii]|uniref:Uncharacterized protein n=1 Tax=Rhododendron simsii TaxID=118357 RepID=A0A834HDG0_RHOSS|nr:hypothetical protein RHSIM_Rhsim02G0090500 [Rhododendron simsii]